MVVVGALPLCIHSEVSGGQFERVCPWVLLLRIDIVNLDTLLHDSTVTHSLRKTMGI